MGQFSLDEIKHPDDCPPENKWKIYWWVMCNFYDSIVEVLKNEEKNLSSSTNNIKDELPTNTPHNADTALILISLAVEAYGIFPKENNSHKSTANDQISD
jgi:hypothetical protein